MFRQSRLHLAYRIAFRRTSSVGGVTRKQITTKALLMAIAAIAALAIVASPASAASTTLALSSKAAPTNFAPASTNDQYVLSVINTGGAPTDGSDIVVHDALPAGLTVTSIFGFEYFSNGPVTCTSEPTTCTYEGTLPANDTLTIIVNVAVAPGTTSAEPNSVTLSGGGATSVTTSSPTVISAIPAPPGLQSLDGEVSNRDGSAATQAGSHPYSASLDFEVNTKYGAFAPVPSGPLKDTVVNLPAGFIGNPEATPKCALSDFSASRCPSDSQVGVAGVEITDGLHGDQPVFNLKAPSGAPAELGFLFAANPVYLKATVRTGGDYGVTLTSSNLATAVSLFGVRFTLWGVPADPSHDSQRCAASGSIETLRSCAAGITPQPFLTNPTRCTAPGEGLETQLLTDFWTKPGAFTSNSFVTHLPYPEEATEQGTDGCGRVPFAPTISVAPDNSRAGAPAGYQVSIHVPQNENPTGLAQADLKTAVVALPSGVVVSPSAADGLGGCGDGSGGTPNQIGLGSADAPACPDSSKIGTVAITTPLLETPLTGSVYLANQGNNPFHSLLALYLVAQGDGVTIKLAGKVSADPVTGQLTATFDENPQLPFTDLQVNFKGGPRAPLANPVACGTYTATAELTPWTGTAPATPTSSFAVNEGCAAPLPFGPSLSTGSVTTERGAFSPFTFTLSRGEREQTLGRIAVHTPPGLLAVLKGVSQCPEPQASQGACGPASLIGHTTVAAGAGSSPFYLGGSVYLTGPYHGAPFGLSIVVPAIAGPFNLGTVVVRAAIAIDPATAQLTITSDPLPTILQGIPLGLRVVNVTVDRAAFMFNPTDCAASKVDATAQSAQGAVAASSTPFQVANCATLPFKPKLSASAGGKASKAGGASLDVKIASRGGPQPGAGEANIASVKVALPKQLPSRLTTLQKACLAATFEANPANCPAASNVGMATAATPILAHPLSGPAYLVSHGGAAFPDLEIVLQGEGVTIVLDGKTDIKKGITSSTFKAVPDAPISSFELKLPTGYNSILTSNVPQAKRFSLCGQTLNMPTAITGQNGAALNQTTKIAIDGCPKVEKAQKNKAKKAKKATHAQVAAEHGRKA
jgi:hypothetical protein